MPQLKGVIKTPTGEPLGGATITLTSLHNRAGILKSVFSHVTTQNGEYDFPVLPGVYSVRLTQSAQRLSEIGVIRVYEDSADGSLNDFLGATDIDLRPESLKKYEELAQQAQQSAEAAAESEQQAGKHAGAAALAKEEVKKLAAGVQQNAEAVAEDKRQVETLTLQVEDTASEVRQDAEAAKKAASDAEQARADIDTALSATLKTANHLSEIAAEGEEAQQDSRDNLGLKSAATMEPQSDIRDRTEDRLAVPGAFGFGHMFLPGEVIRFDSENDLLEWVRYVTPGEYSVQAANYVLPGGNTGVISIRFLEANQYPPVPRYTAKAVIFYGVNGHIYYNRYWPLSGGYLTGWENLKTNEEYFLNLINARAPLNSPAFTGTPTTPTPPDDATGLEMANAAFVRKLLAGLVGSSPEALDTLNELAAALGNDPNFATTVTNALAGKQPLNAVLTALSNLTQRAGTLPYFNADEDVTLAPLSEKGRSLLAQETPDAMRTALELKSAATMEPQSDIRDRTEDRLAVPGAFGFGHMFLPGEIIRFNSESDFLAWVKQATPGEYLVDGNNKIIPGDVLFIGIVSIRWIESRYATPNPPSTTKAITFSGINGDIYYNRYWYSSTGYLAGWEKLKLKNIDFIDMLSSYTGSTSTGDPDVGGLVLAAYQGKADGDTQIIMTRGHAYSGSSLTPLSVSIPNDRENVATATPSITTRGCRGWCFPGVYIALNGAAGNARGDNALVGLFIRYL